MTDTPRTDALLPCPFCGAGKTEIEGNGRMWTGMRYSDPVSYSVRHWCSPITGQPSRLIERVGKDRESAIAAWNRRTPPQTSAEGDKADAEVLLRELVENESYAAVSYREIASRPSAAFESKQRWQRARAHLAAIDAARAHTPEQQRQEDLLRYEADQRARFLADERIRHTPADPKGQEEE